MQISMKDKGETLTSRDFSNGTESMNVSYILRLRKALLSAIFLNELLS